MLTSFGTLKNALFANAQLVSIILSLFSMTVWGFSDFIGGYASRQTNAFLLTAVSHLGGLVFMTTLALSWHAPLPPERAILWAMAAGLFGGTALAVFYRALAMGQMGITAPIAALLGAAIPTIVSFFSEGLPGTITIAGFLLAAIGIWLIARSEEEARRHTGLSLAIVSGIGFAGFFLCVKQAGDVSPLWVATFVRLASIATTGSIVLFARQTQPLVRSGIWLGILAGVLDSGGTALFTKASQSGRLDTAVVISSLYPAITVLLARFVLRESFSRWKLLGLIAALVAVPMIAM